MSTLLPSYWGAYASTAQLPNVAGATKQSSRLRAGDTAFVTGGVPYYCVTATPGAAAWSVIGGSSSALFVDLPIVDGQTLAAADCVSFSATFAGTAGGRVRRADARMATAVSGFAGACVVGGTGDAGGSVLATVQIAGIYTDAGAAFTPGKLYLSVSAAGGRPTNTLPSGSGNWYVEVGEAVSATAWSIRSPWRYQIQ